MFIINVLAILVFVDTVDASTININDGLRITHQTAFISPISKNKRSRLYTKKPDPPSIKPPPLEDAILNGDDVETPPLFDVSSSVDQEAVKEFGVNLSKNLSKTYVAPVFSNEVVKGVPQEILKGALVSGIALSVLAGKGIFLGGATGLGFAYVATTPGPTGDSVRIVGKATWTSTQILLNLNKKYEVGKKVGMFLKSVLPAARAFGKSERLKALAERLLDEVNDRMEEELAPPLEDADNLLAVEEEEEEENVVVVALGGGKGLGGYLSSLDSGTAITADDSDDDGDEVPKTFMSDYLTTLTVEVDDGITKLVKEADRLEKDLVRPPAVEVDDEITRIVKEAEDTVAVQNILDEENTEEAKVLENGMDATATESPHVDLTIEYDSAAKLAYDQWREQYDKGDFDDERYDVFKANYETLTISNVVAAKQARESGEVCKRLDLDESADTVILEIATSKAAAKVQKAQNDERKQRSLLESRLETETTEKSRKAQIEAEQKQRSLLESRLEIETTEKTEKSRKVQIEAERKQRSLLKSRLEIETTEKIRKVQVETERKQRSLLESRLEIETTEKTRKEQIEAERNQRSLLETKLKIETAERHAKAAAELRKAQIEAKSEVADELNTTPELSENLIDEPDVTSSEPEVSMEDQYIEEDDWEDSIRLAESLDSESAENTIDEPDVTSRKPKVEMEEISISFDAENDIEEELDAARELANSLIDESENILGETEMTMEELGKAARAAVDQYEREQQEKEIDMVKKEKTKSSDRTLEASQDYESLTVVKIKDILRSRGLKVSGKKADLIIRLRENE